MLTDFFTKPLQGALFKKFRDMLLGYKHTDSLTTLIDDAAQERVGKRPANDESGDSKTGKREIQKKKVTWAQVVAGSMPASPAKRGLGRPNGMSRLS